MRYQSYQSERAYQIESHSCRGAKATATRSASFIDARGRKVVSSGASDLLEFRVHQGLVISSAPCIVLCRCYIIVRNIYHSCNLGNAARVIVGKCELWTIVCVHTFHVACACLAISVKLSFSNASATVAIYNIRIRKLIALSLKHWPMRHCKVASLFAQKSLENEAVKNVNESITVHSHDLDAIPPRRWKLASINLYIQFR
jgi:hypothetical protein